MLFEFRLRNYSINKRSASSESTTIAACHAWSPSWSSMPRYAPEVRLHQSVACKPLCDQMVGIHSNENTVPVSGIAVACSCTGGGSVPRDSRAHQVDAGITRGDSSSLPPSK